MTGQAVLPGEFHQWTVQRQQGYLDGMDAAIQQMNASAGGARVMLTTAVREAREELALLHPEVHE